MVKMTVWLVGWVMGAGLLASVGYGASIPVVDSVMAQTIEQCVHVAASEYAVPTAVLLGIVQVESSGWPLALAVREGSQERPVYARTVEEAHGLVMQWWRAGKAFSVGLGQIHTINIKKYKLDPVWLLDPCVNMAWAAFILRTNFEQYGFNWTAVERYNGKNPEYPWRVWRAMGQQRQ